MPGQTRDPARETKTETNAGHSTNPPHLNRLYLIINSKSYAPSNLAPFFPFSTLKPKFIVKTHKLLCMV